MNPDCITLVFQKSDSEVKLAFSLTCKWLNLTSKSYLITIEEAIKKHDVLSIINSPYWYLSIDERNIGSIGSVFLLRAYRRNMLTNLYIVMKYACSGGHLDLVKYLFSEHNNELQNFRGKNIWFYEACYGGNLDIIKIMIGRGLYGWDLGFDYACIGNKFEAAKFLIECGTTRTDDGFIQFCMHKNVKAVKFMLEHGTNPSVYGLKNACESGNIEIIKLMIEHGSDDLNEGLSAACYAGHTDVIKLMIECGATECYCGTVH